MRHLLGAQQFYRNSRIFYKKNKIFRLLLFQISVSFVSDICRARFRYLSRSSQISVSCELDIIKNCILYTSTLQYLKDIYIDEDYEYFYSAIFRLKYYYRYLINNMFFGILLYKNTFFYNCLPLHRAYIFSSE